MSQAHEFEGGDAIVKADNHRLAATITGYNDLILDASKADKKEHEMTAKQAFVTYKKAVMWSAILSAALIMEGYDVVVIASFYGQPAFLERFGVPGPDGTNIIPAPWQSGLGNGSSVGGIIGLLINGWASERFGSKKTYLAGMVLMMAAIFIPFFSNSLGMLVAGEVICGIPWGIFQTLTTQYASEVCPIQLRHYLTAYINMCWGIGIFLSSGVVRATLNIDGNLSWRLPFALQWIWPPFLFAAVWFCPVSPWWLVRQGKLDEAEENVMRLTNPALFSRDDAKRTVAMMVHTTELEKQAEVGTSYIDCFKGIDRRRTEIAMMVFFIQLGSGQNLIGQGVQFFQRAGIDSTTSFNLNMALNSMFIIGTVASWFLLRYFGRRTLYVAGLILMDVVLIIVGGMAFSNSKASAWVSGSLLICLNFCYNATLGPVCYTIISEVGSTRLRAKTIVLARCAYAVANIICGIIVPRMLSPTAWNWGAKSGLFWAGSCFLCLVYCLLRLPETRGKSYGELEVLFENRVPAWKFAKTKVDQFDLGEDASTPVQATEIKEDFGKVEDTGKVTYR